MKQIYKYFLFLVLVGHLGAAATSPEKATGSTAAAEEVAVGQPLRSIEEGFVRATVPEVTLNAGRAVMQIQTMGGQFYAVEYDPEIDTFQDLARRLDAQFPLLYGSFLYGKERVHINDPRPIGEVLPGYVTNLDIVVTPCIEREKDSGLIYFTLTNLLPGKMPKEFNEDAKLILLAFISELQDIGLKLFTLEEPVFETFQREFAAQFPRFRELPHRKEPSEYHFLPTDDGRFFVILFGHPFIEILCNTNFWTYIQIIWDDLYRLSGAIDLKYLYYQID